MHDPIDVLENRRLGRGVPRPDPAEVADVLCQAALPDGFSMEWMFDRYAAWGADAMFSRQQDRPCDNKRTRVLK